MNYDKDIEKLYDHAKIANEEMSVVKNEMTTIKNDILWLKGWMQSMDIKVWGVLIGLLIALIKLFI